MFDLVVLTCSESTANAFSGWSWLLQEAGDKALVKGHDPIVVRGQLSDEEIPTHFRRVFSHLSAVADNADCAFDDARRLMVWVDSVIASKLSATGHGWEGLVAALILAFPDAHWVFGHVAHEEDDAPPWHHRHGFRALWRGEVYDPLFDPSGLRDWVRDKTRDALRYGKQNLPARPQVSAVLEEEPGYAYLHAYTVYRFGSRAEVVLTKRQMTALFGRCPDDADKEEIGHGYWLLLEDMSLNFPDKREKDHWLSLEKRGEDFKKLARDGGCEDSTFRTLITTGQTGNPEDGVLENNREYLEGKYKSPKKPENVILCKPTNGMFSLWGDIFAGIEMPFCDGDEVPRLEGNGRSSTQTDSTVEKPTAVDTDHGAPGRLFMIADSMIARVRRREGEATSVQGAARCAVLATDAVELIGYKTPNTAFDAVRLKHRCEALAECLLLGSEHHTDLEERFKEIDRQINRASEPYKDSRQSAAADNVKLTIYSDLAVLFRDHGQFDEELQCINKSRKHHFALLLAKTSDWVGPWEVPDIVADRFQEVREKIRPIERWAVSTVKTVREHIRPLERWSVSTVKSLIFLVVKWASNRVEFMLESGRNFIITVMRTWGYLTLFLWLSPWMFGVGFDNGQQQIQTESAPIFCYVQAAVTTLVSGGKPEGFSNRCADLPVLGISNFIFEAVVLWFVIVGYVLFAMLLAHLYLLISRR